MSRLLISLSIVSSLTSLATADRTTVAAAPRFAQPPHEVAEARITVDRAAVRTRLLANRTANLARFRAYQTKGVFPSNTYRDDKLNVWLDRDGHFCAAATIIRMSGQTALVDKVAEQDNFIRLADVSQGPVMGWILTSGFTQAEIAAIQEPFMPVMGDAPVLDQPAMVDARLRRTEDARLRARYRTVDAMIVKQQKASLDAAVDRLMAHPDVALALVSSPS